MALASAIWYFFGSIRFEMIGHKSLSFQSEYAEHFDSRTLITDPIPVIPAPAPKGTDLNFLKPGSREVLHRPVYVHEYLPPMFPGKIQILSLQIVEYD